MSLQLLQGLIVSGELELAGVLSPSQITADQNNYNPTGLSQSVILRIDTDAARTLTGLAGGAKGRVIVVEYVGANSLVFSDENASSTTTNRFALPGDIALSADESLILAYDDTSGRWRAIGKQTAGGGGSPSGIAGGVLDGTYPNPGLAAGVAGAGLSEALDVLSVNVDASTIEINADTLRVKAGGITGNEIATAIKDPAAATAGLRTLGTGAAQAAAGNDSRLSDSRAPTGSAGGDLSGTYPNPSVVQMSVTEAPTNQGASGVIVTMTYGESLVPGDLVYFDSTGVVLKADANAAGKYPALGMALDTASSGSHRVLLMGIYRDDSRYAFTVGGLVYLSTTAGTETQTQPSSTDDVIQVVGIATHADRIFFNPQLVYITHV